MSRKKSEAVSQSIAVPLSEELAQVFQDAAFALGLSESEMGKQCLARGLAEVCRDLNAYHYDRNSNKNEGRE